MKIHAKAFLYFLIFTCIFHVLISMIYFMVIRHLNNCEQVLLRFTRLNDTEYHVQGIVNSLNQYLSRGHDEDKFVLQRQIRLLKDTVGSLPSGGDLSVAGYYRLENLRNLVNQFTTQAEQSISAYGSKDVRLYTQQYVEATQVSEFIVEAIRQAMSSDLIAYREKIERMGESKGLIRIMWQTTLFVSIVLSLLFSLFIYSGVSLPIQQLVRRSKKIASGDFDVSDIQIDRKDEIGILTNAYVVMGRNIERLLKEAKQKEEFKRLLQEMELKSLQNQINPHFLFNTLNVISRIAYMEKAWKTEELMNALSKLLRHHFKKMDSRVTLGEELNHIQQYLHIQKTRFQDRVKVDLEVDEQCLDVEMPVLTLQPLIENMFAHGIGGMESGAVISVKIYPKGSHVIVRLSDNGQGMAEETVKNILSFAGSVTENRESGGIGLRNVIRRLQIFYQSKDVISIDSKPGEGTTIHLFLPRSMQRKESFIFQKKHNSVQGIYEKNPLR